MTEHYTSTRATTTTTTTNEADLENQQIDNDTEAIMKQPVAKSTREIYEMRNSTFILWLFDHNKKYPSPMQPTLYDMTKTNNLKDMSRMKI